MDTITPRFVSAKTATTIPAACSLVREALVQATLDPQVRAIEFIAQARVGASLVNLDAIVLARVDGRFRLDVIEARQVRDVESERLAVIALGDLGLSPIVLTAADIKREPRFTNSRLAWSCRQHISEGLGGQLVYRGDESMALREICRDRNLRVTVEGHLQELHCRAEIIVRRHRDAIAAIAAELAVKRFLSGAAIEAIMAQFQPIPRPPGIVTRLTRHLSTKLNR